MFACSVDELSPRNHLLGEISSGQLNVVDWPSGSPVLVRVRAKVERELLLKPQPTHQRRHLLNAGFVLL